MLPLKDQGVREAFIVRLTQEFVEDRSAEELFERFKQACEDVRNGDTKSIEELGLSKRNAQTEENN